MFDNKRLSRAMLSLKAGDESVFEYIYDQTNRLVYYQIYSIVADHGLTEEVMQDVYMKIIDKINTYEDKTYPKAWIMMIARNEALNLLKKRKRELIISDEKISFISADEKSESPLIDTAHEILDEQSFLIVMYCVVENKNQKKKLAIFLICQLQA